MVLMSGLGLLGVLARLLLDLTADEQPSMTVIRTIITIPPTYSASVNCQPISSHKTTPSSHTRLVEANWKASALAALAPF